MKSQIKVCLFILIVFVKTSFAQGGLWNGFTYSVPDMPSIGAAAVVVGLLGGSAFLCAGNEIHVSYNHTPAIFIWNQTKGQNLKGGHGFNIEQQHDFNVKNRIFWGFQGNYYKTETVSSNPIKRNNYYYFGYMRELKAENELNWKPYVGGSFLLNENRAGLGLFVGSKLPLSKNLHLENRLSVGNKNINVQLGLTCRYKKSKN